MADYNSPYTGAEIDASIGKVESLRADVQIYAGAPTNGGIQLSSLSINPDTGDRTGIYDIVLSPDSTDISSPGSEAFFSTLYIPNLSGIAMGTLSGGMSDIAIIVRKARYDGDNGDGPIIGLNFRHLFSSGVKEVTPLYIHEIWRRQSPAV